MQDKKIPEFKAKIEAVFKKIGVPMRAYFAISTDFNRKPRIGMWQELEAVGLRSLFYHLSKSPLKG